MNHDFHSDIQESEKDSKLDFWEPLYRRVFPGFTRIEYIYGKCELQEKGVDRILTFPSGMQITFDEKVRRGQWEDFLIEFWSNKEMKSKGWAFKPLICDFITYVNLDLRTAYFVPFQKLQNVLRHTAQDWWENLTHKSVKNKVRTGHLYTTENIVVPWEVLFREMGPLNKFLF